MLIILAALILLAIIYFIFYCSMNATCRAMNSLTGGVFGKTFGNHRIGSLFEGIGNALGSIVSMGGGGENNKGDKNNKLKQINKFKDKILNTNFFKIANQSNNEGKWYMYVEFSKDSLRRTYIKVPYIVYVETKDLESMDKFNKKYSIKLKNFIPCIKSLNNLNSACGNLIEGSIWKKILINI